MAQIQASDLGSYPFNPSEVQTDRSASASVGRNNGQPMGENAKRRRQRPLGAQRRKNKLRGRQ